MITLQKYEKVWSMTPYSNFELLCTVIHYDKDTNMVLLQLPCNLQGKNQCLVPFSDIRVQQPKAQQPEVQAFNPTTKTNPFKKWLCEVERRIDQREQNEQKQVSKPVQNVAPAAIDAETQQLLQGLSPEEKRAYMEILK